MLPVAGSAPSQGCFLQGKDETHFFQCNVNAIRAAFLPEAVKERLESELREAYERT
jgi:hypothetical protein